MKRLPRRAGIAVTGTPLENRLTDLWSLFDFAVPGLLGDLPSFEATFEPQDLAAPTRLEPLISPLMLRRRVSEVAVQLPARITIPQPLALSAQGVAEYEQIRKDLQLEYGNAASFVSLIKLRMYCAHRSIVEPAFDPAPLAQSPKYERLVEILEEVVANGQKALVFTSFTKMIDLIVEGIRTRTSAYVDWIDGRVASEMRQSKVDEFEAFDGPAILVLNPRTGGTGLNLTAATHVIHYNLEWNPAVEDQASARAHRLGQRVPVTIHRLYYVNTVEEVMNDRLDRKRRLAGAAVVGTRGEHRDRADILKALRASPLDS